MWKICNFGVKNQLEKRFCIEEVPLEIRQLLLYRFIYASWICMWLEYLFLIIFLVCVQFDLLHPAKGFVQIIQCTLISLYTWILMHPLLMILMFYGLILFYIHNLRYTCYDRSWKRVLNELPPKLMLMVALLCLSSYTGWLYIIFVESFTGHRWSMLTYCSFCGFFCFMVQHGQGYAGFQRPVIRLELKKELILVCWSCLKCSMRDTLVPTLCFVALYWSSKVDIYQQPRLIWQTWCLGTLVTAKLHLVKAIYGLILQQQLPLVIQTGSKQFYEPVCLHALLQESLQLWLSRMFLQPVPPGVGKIRLKVPIGLALTTECMRGFQLQAAKDFFEEINSKSSKLCTKIFKLKCRRRSLSDWHELRKVLMYLINDFRCKLDDCLMDLQCPQRPTMCELLQRGPPKSPLLRPLRKPPILQKQPLVSSPNPDVKWNPCKLRSRMRKFLNWLKNYWCNIWPSFLSFVPKRLEYLVTANPLAEINHLLRCSEPLIWILQAVVAICVRSLNEDRYGQIGSDLPEILDALMDIENKLAAARQLQILKQGKLCSNHELLWATTSRCLYKMLLNFGPNLRYILEDNHQLLNQLQRRAEFLD